MKKLFIAATILASSFASAQWVQSGTKITTGNAVGIGVANPTNALEVNGTVKWGNSILTPDQGGSIRLLSTIGATAQTPYFDFMNNTADPYYDARFILTGDDKLSLYGSILETSMGIEMLHSTFGAGFGSRIVPADFGNGSTGMKFQVRGNSASYSDAMTILATQNSKNGFVGIGSLNPDERLTVKGKIHAEEVRVDLLVPADYVFEKYYTGKSKLKSDYIMPTLLEVEKYTKENNHLPNVPSAKVIKENGMSLGEMTNILLQKIEELTLYTIEQQKRIDALEVKVRDN
jgi:hypothetical protein